MDLARIGFSEACRVKRGVRSRLLSVPFISIYEGFVGDGKVLSAIEARSN